MSISVQDTSDVSDALVDCTVSGIVDHTEDVRIYVS